VLAVAPVQHLDNVYLRWGEPLREFRGGLWQRLQAERGDSHLRAAGRSGHQARERRSDKAACQPSSCAAANERRE
jgi:hypothetical protein